MMYATSGRGDQRQHALAGFRHLQYQRPGPGIFAGSGIQEHESTARQSGQTVYFARK